MIDFPLDIAAWKRTQPQFEILENGQIIGGLPYQRTLTERQIHKTAFKCALAKKYIRKGNPLYEPWWADWFHILDRCVSAVDHRHEYDQMDEVAMMLGHFGWSFIAYKGEDA